MRFLVFFLCVGLFCNVAQAEEFSTAQSKVVPITISPVDRPAVQRLEDYLSSIKTISAKFSQISPDGGISSGKFYLQRPGKLRMEYDPPVPVLVIGSDGNIVYHDKELNQVTNVSLDSTLVGFLAREKVRFDDNVTIVHFERGQKSLRIGIVQADKLKDGRMTIEFTDKPLLLRNIIITDSAEQSTIVSLADARFGAKLDAELFVFKDPNFSGTKHIRK